jgi:hypothetical protein
MTPSFGIWNNATTNITGGTITGYTTDYPYNGNTYTASCVRNYGTLTQSGGTISESTYGIHNQSNATYTLTGGNITANTYIGVNNNGTFNQTGGNIYSNGKDSNYGVYQNGTYNLSGTATVNSNNVIYLCSGKVINIPSALSTSGFKIATADDDKAVGRKLVTAWTGFSDEYRDKFSLVSSKLSHNNDGTAFNGIADTGVIHKGAQIDGWTDANGNKLAEANALYLTGQYYVYYDEDLEEIGFTNDYDTEALRNETVRYDDDEDMMLLITKPSEPFYWNETTQFTTDQTPIVYYIIDD